MPMIRDPAATPDYEIDLVEIFRSLWTNKWIVISVTLVFAVGSIAYALTATEWYRSDTLLSPAMDGAGQSLAGQLGSLATLAGVALPQNDQTAEAIAILQSRDFIRSFIEEEQLMSTLFPDDWGEAARAADPAAERPDIREAVKYFRENVQRVEQDDATGLVTLTIDWIQPELAAEWANLLATRLNNHMRSRALAEAQANVAFLREELTQANVLSIQQSISRLLEGELQKLMLARGNEEFVFRVIDQAQVPVERQRPRRTLIVIIAVVVGGAVGVLAALFRETLRRSRPEARSTLVPAKH